MTKFKVGDAVKIKSPRFGPYNNIAFIQPMKQYSGKNAIITTVSSNDGIDYYNINLDNNEWVWFNDMFEDYVISQNNIDNKQIICDTQTVCDTQTKFNKQNIILKW